MAGGEEAGLRDPGGSGGEAASMDRTLARIARRAPVTAGPDDLVAFVLSKMHREAVGSVIVVDGERRPLGIFTLQDLLKRVVLAGCDLAAPVSSVMTEGVFTLPAAATAYDAALAMVREGIRHVVVADGAGRVAGIVSEKDLFALQSTSLRRLSHEIRAAPDLAALVALAGEIRSLAASRLARGVSSEQLTRLIASLNDLLTRRVIELELAATDPGVGVWCWIALGSEGRHEQTLATDQDNGIVFETPEGEEPEAPRERLVPFALRVNRALEACGFPLCKGGVMASNPRWCLDVAEWRREFARWIDSGNPEALLNGTIFFDFRPLAGEERLAAGLREWLAGAAAKNDRFLRQMAENALRNRPPLGMIRDFAVERSGEHRGTVNLKVNGAALFVDAARIFALAAGVTATSTAERLRGAAGPLHLREEEVEGWLGAFYHLQALRLRSQRLAAENAGAPNRIAPRSLNNLERTILKESLRQAKAIQARLALRYQL